MNNADAAFADTLEDWAEETDRLLARRATLAPHVAAGNPLAVRCHARNEAAILAHGA